MGWSESSCPNSGLLTSNLRLKKSESACTRDTATKTVKRKDVVIYVELGGKSIGCRREFGGNTKKPVCMHMAEMLAVVATLL